MKTLKSFSLRLFITVFLILFSGLGLTESNTAAARPPHGNPAWAPPYYTGVRYYYLPDIEAYYDIRRGQFVYFRNGHWLFSSTLPGIYGSFDLFNGFVVSLNVGAVDPWRYHTRYVTRYPRYYYEEVYYRKNIRDIRGYNENSRRPYYLKEGAKRGGWKEIYKKDRKQQKEYEKGRKQEWKHEGKEGRGNKHGRK